MSSIAVKFWQELRRRRVYRLAGLYIVGAWLVIQVADISFPAWGVPDTALRYLFIAAAACFPIALIFSWYYDITSRGIVRTAAADGSEPVDLTLKRSDYVVLCTLLTIGLVVLLGSANKIQDEIDSPPAVVVEAVWRENSIAVLPFTNLDSNPDTGYFSDGITEEILYRLSSLGSLHVLASNSSFAFRDSEVGPTEIREILGVRYLLQGSIRRENDFVRVTARLIDEGGFQVWSEAFERKLEGIFAIQTEIASTVASQIIQEIVPLQDLPAGRTTTNMEAYNQYLIGRAFLDARTADWRNSATAAFRDAIKLDAGFAPAYAGLAMTITVNRRDGPQWRESEQLLEKALDLDPSLAEAHAAIALNLMASGELSESILSSRRALELDGSLGFAHNILANALNRLGRFDEAMIATQKGLSVDPLNPPLVMNMADYESRAGNFDRAERLLQRLVNLPNPPPAAFSVLYFLYDSWGQFDSAIATAKQYARVFAASGDTQPFAMLAWAYGFLGMNEDADFWKDLILESAEDDVSNLDLTYNLARTRPANSPLRIEIQTLVDETAYSEDDHNPWVLAQFGLVNIQAGNFRQGSEQLEFGLRLYQRGEDGTGAATRIDVLAMDGSPDDIVFLIQQLAFAYQQTDRNDDADRLLQQLSDAFGMENNALHLALTGDTAGALQALRSNDGRGWSAYYGPGKYYEIINEVAWAQTIEAPEFQALLSEFKQDVERQRAIVEAANAEHDFRAEIMTLLGP